MQILNHLILNINAISSPHKNGVLLFVLGIVFILTIYHFLLYFQHKSSTYIYYALYTLLLFLAYFTFTENDFLDKYTKPIKSFFGLIHQFIVWGYNIVYFYFAFRFLNFKKHHPKNTSVIKKILISLFILGTTGAIYTVINQNDEFLNLIYIALYVPIIILLTLYCFYLVYKTPEKTKFYILIGSFVLFVSSLLTILIIDFNVFTNNDDVGFLIFYLGIVIENVFFSLGLGLRQKEILAERNEAKNKLIQKLQENEDLKEKVNIQLKEKINVLNEQIKLKEEVEVLKLTAFRSQMNPHFIFNALNSIKLYIVSNESKKAAHYLNKFSKLIRKILDASSSKKTSLKEELETMDLYLTIENIRFSNEINFQFNIEENLDLNSIYIPPLILQPFLENAIWHGLSSKKGKKNININIQKNNDFYIQITIEDNGIGRKAAEKIKQQKSIHRNSVGIALTNERLNNFASKFKHKFSLFFNDLENQNNEAIGTRVTLNIPTQ